MKKILIGLFLTMLIFMLVSCSTSLDNSITFRNLAAGEIYINFRGDIITVLPGNSAVVKEMPKGTYSYSTTYAVPSGITGHSASGDVSGSLSVGAGTKIMVLYSSVIADDIYTISATVSSNDDSGGAP